MTFYIKSEEDKIVLELGIFKNEYDEVKVSTLLDIKNYSYLLVKMYDMHGEFISDFESIMNMKGSYYDEGVNALEEITIMLRSQVIRLSEKYNLEFSEY